MAVSEAMRAANRANAQRSTGPRTAAGKARARLNALRHGLAGRIAVLPGEEEGFARLEADMAARFRPEGELEAELVREMAAALWRLGRAPGAEAAALVANADETLYAYNPMAATLGAPGAVDILLRMGRYEAQVQRSYERARERLLALKQARAVQGAQPEPPRPAAARAEPAASRPQNPQFSAGNGFVSSTPPHRPREPLAKALLASTSPLAIEQAAPFPASPAGAAGSSAATTAGMFHRR